MTRARVSRSKMSPPKELCGTVPRLGPGFFSTSGHVDKDPRPRLRPGSSYGNIISPWVGGTAGKRPIKSRGSGIPRERPVLGTWPFWGESGLRPLDGCAILRAGAGLNDSLKSPLRVSPNQFFPVSEIAVQAPFRVLLRRCFSVTEIPLVAPIWMSPRGFSSFSEIALSEIALSVLFWMQLCTRI
jgi:hypothetical protein